MGPNVFWSTLQCEDLVTENVGLILLVIGIILYYFQKKTEKSPVSSASDSMDYGEVRCTVTVHMYCIQFIYILIHVILILVRTSAEGTLSSECLPISYHT